MAEKLVNPQDNQRRISLVEKCFGADGRPLASKGRVLIGEGILTKACRKKLKPRHFFLFNDLFVYGNIVINKKKYNKQRIIPLENVKLQSLEDDGPCTNGWLVCTKGKSFAVYAASLKEKQQWMTHINRCIYELLTIGGRIPAREYAAVWVPDSEARFCMICKQSHFSMLNRRHHCRKCGAVCCGQCSMKKYLLPNQSRKPVRVCDLCFDLLSRHNSNSVLANRPLIKPGHKEWSSIRRNFHPTVNDIKALIPPPAASSKLAPEPLPRSSVINCKPPEPPPRIKPVNTPVPNILDMPVPDIGNNEGIAPLNATTPQTEIFEDLPTPITRCNTNKSCILQTNKRDDLFRTEMAMALKDLSDTLAKKKTAKQSKVEDDPTPLKFDDKITEIGIGIDSESIVRLKTNELSFGSSSDDDEIIKCTKLFKEEIPIINPSDLPDLPKEELNYQISETDPYAYRLVDLGETFWFLDEEDSLQANRKSIFDNIEDFTELEYEYDFNFPDAVSESSEECSDDDEDDNKKLNIKDAFKSREGDTNEEEVSSDSGGCLWYSAESELSPDTVLPAITAHSMNLSPLSQLGPQPRGGNLNDIS